MKLLNDMNRSTSFTIGKVTGVHGLKGNLKVWSYAQSIETFGSGRTVLLKTESGQEKRYTIRHAAPHKKGLRLSLEGVENRNLAEALVGCEILIDRDQLPEPEEDAWYWEDLIGLTVIDKIRGEIGTISNIFPTGANDVLVIAGSPTSGPDKSAEKEILVPMHKNFVADVDLDKQVLTTTLPEDYE